MPTSVTSGTRIVSSGIVETGDFVGLSGTVFVGSGGVASGTFLEGGTQVVQTGAIADGTVVSGGREDITGTANGTVVSAGSAMVSSVGQANGLVVDSGASATVVSGGAISGVTLSNGALEIQSGGLALSSTVTFAGGGALILDDAKFHGKIAGFAVPDTIDLTTVSFASATLAYSGNTLSGTLTVSDGAHTARLLMLGNYQVANFQKADDGHGGTLISDPPLSSGSTIVPPH